MARWQYKAKNHNGVIVTGTLEANSKDVARNRLGSRRMKVLSLKNLDGGKVSQVSSDVDDGEVEYFGGLFYKDKSGTIQIGLGQGNPTSKDLIVFTKQLATMINSGVPLIQALDLLSKQQRLRSFGKLIRQIRHTVENGAKLSDAFAGYPKIFDSLFVSMVRAGEASGNLDKILMKLVTYIEKAAKIKSQVKSAMMYPMIVMVVAFGVIAALLVFVVPIFAKQFDGTGKELPGLTQFVISMSETLQNNWLEIIGAIALAITAVKLGKKTERGALFWDEFMLKVPGIGMLLKKIAVGRFCTTMATMLTSGVNLLEALQICAASAGNRVIEKFVMGMRVKIEQGVKFSEPLGEGTLFPPMVVSMVSVGEQTGALDEMLQKVSEFYEEEVDLAVQTVLAMIEPILIVFIGGFVGFIVIAMYLPIFDIAGTIN